ncbi:MAG: GNAT family N-acetyltransferase [Candidatus Sulfotelmatobacter sp.]|jgi:CelD/BcsL family acetyltransferase involved in cellulose biosynthesis
MASDQSCTITVYDSLESLEHLRPEWDALLGEYPFSTVFSTYEWLAPWWRAFGATDRLQVLAFRDASSALVGLAPLALTTGRAFPVSLRLLRLMGDGSHDSDNLDLPVRPGWETSMSQALLHWMQRNAALWDVCELNTLPSSSAAGARLLEDLGERKWKYFTSTQPQTVVELGETWESHLKGISSKERGKIGLRTRRLEKKYEVRIRRCQHESEIDALLQALYELHGKHWQLRGLPGTLHSPARRQFYGELARLLLARRQLEFWVLEVQGKVVAAQFGLRYGTTVFSLQEGFDPDYAADSVGYVLRSQVLKQVIADGVRRYDFLGGTDESKMRWGAEVKNYLNLHFARPWCRGSLHLALRNESSNAKRWLRGHLPAAAWASLKGAIGKKG